VFEFFRSLVQIVAPIFVVSTMLNVGLTQKLSDITGHLKNYPFVLKMLAANFVLAPLLMIFVLTFTSFDPALRDGLLIFALCAGAPFLIKLTQTAEHSMALGAAVMILLIVATVIYVPVVLPIVMYEVAVDGWAIAKALFLQMLLPIVVGMLAVQFMPEMAKKFQPWVGRLGNVTLYVLLAATLIGYFPNMIGIVGTGAILVGLVFVAAAFGIGYLMGSGRDHLEDVGGLGTAQRNTAAGVIIATQNFDDPNVLVMITLANTLGIVMLLLIAKRLSRDNKVEIETV
jgi:BASS family bile acid:Na+ symporter